MSRRCKPGMRAKIIGGLNVGKIVVVVRRYFGETINGATWPRPMFPWVVTSLTGPLRHMDLETKKLEPPAMTVVIDDSDLEPLRDDEDEDASSQNHELPKSEFTRSSRPIASA